MMPAREAQSGRWSAGRAPFLLETTAPGVFAVGDGGLAISFARQHLEEPHGAG